ncbi:glutaredoxin family protein [Peribacillus alkalitolerans]|uniref:glutaredoxin family protein n=1 Tax=Peribacillus alkalitolerans TaxID=1550385 RepID=UPI0013D5732B|nr:glutaredoxin family protein [Peribacillus alkalitolerans]
MNTITIYTTNTCPYCTQAKNFLNAQGLSYREINIQQNPDAMQKLVNETGQLGVPQININGNWVLGFDPQAILTFANQGSY